MLAQPGYQYARIWVLCSPESRPGAQELVSELQAQGHPGELRELALSDPTDHGALFHALGALVDELAGLDFDVGVDVNLSAGTPQMQTLWVILVQAGLLRARMLQVIPASFVPHPHPHPVREVRLDIDGFPIIRALRDEVSQLRSEAGTTTAALVGTSQPMQQLRRLIGRVARAEVPVLVHGETGTGKELVARAVHDSSARAEGPFVAENCGAFNDDVLASELFGHEAGAFTGAKSRRRGLIELAHRGTLFLDEVAEMSPRLQVSLLRVLQEGTLRRVGAEKITHVDVRVVAASHRDLREQVQAGRFREDLYYRLRGATLHVPPLRDRGADLELLVRHFAGATPLQPTREAWAHMRAYPWPGNVRELRAEVTRWSVFCQRRVQASDLSEEILQGQSSRKNTLSSPVTSAGIPAVSEAPLAEQVQALERAVITRTLDRHGHNVSRSARDLGVDRNTLKRKISTLGIEHAPQSPGRPVAPVD